MPKTEKQEFDDVIKDLPDNWILVSIGFDIDRNDLYLSRSDGEQVVFKLPLKRHATRQGEDDGLGYEQMEQQFQHIMKENKQSTTSAKHLTKHERKEWYQKRMDLDQMLKEWLETLESKWLGGFKGLMQSKDYISHSVDRHLIQFKDRIEGLVYSSLTKRFITKQNKVSLPIQFYKMILRMGSEPGYDDIEDIIYYLLDCYALHDIVNDELDIDELTEEFKDAIKAFYMELERLKQKETKKHIVLILDKHSQHWPWESLPCLRGESVSRIASYALLKELRKPLDFEPRSVFYMLNPSGDLTKTQSNFQHLLKKPGFQGIVGSEPQTDLSDRLRSCDLFLYFGHGGTEKYIQEHHWKELHGKVPPSLLFGCSSGHLKKMGFFDPHGISLDYLLHGAPAVLGNLWDVTDVDIDKYALDLLDRWLFQKKDDLGQATSKAREACQLKYLVGASPVLYGLPLHL
ncbi:peptidase family C50-domain-containing protein [Gorgonomyces haynaldii]|nr:peptidase family C50-domain-containing protein [Gorgonomyces haynaldii]